MPVVFQQPDPVGVGIESAYGATQQYDKVLPTLAGITQANQHNELQARIAAGQQASRSGEVAAQINARQNEQASQQEFARVQQQRQYEQQSAMQFQQFALEGQKVGQQEIMRMQQQQTALNEIANQVTAGNLTPEESADMVMQLKTGISITQMRLKKEQAENQAALTQQHLQQAAAQQVITNRNLELQGRSTQENTRIHLEPQMEQEERQKLAPKYQALAAVIGEPAAQQAYDNEVRMNVTAKGGATREVIESYDSHGAAHWRALDKQQIPTHDKDLFDSQVKHAEAEDKRWQTDRDHYVTQYDKEQARVEKVMHEQEGRTGSIPEDELAAKVTANLKRKGIEPPGPRPAMPKRPDQNSPNSVASPTDTSGQQAQAANDQRGQPAGAASPEDAFHQQVASNPKISFIDKTRAMGMYQTANQLANKPSRTPEEVRQLKRLLESLDSLTGK